MNTKILSPNFNKILLFGEKKNKMQIKEQIVKKNTDGTITYDEVDIRIPDTINISVLKNYFIVLFNTTDIIKVDPKSVSLCEIIALMINLLGVYHSLLSEANTKKSKKAIIYDHEIPFFYRKNDYLFIIPNYAELIIYSTEPENLLKIFEKILSSISDDKKNILRDVTKLFTKNQPKHNIGIWKTEDITNCSSFSSYNALLCFFTEIIKILRGYINDCEEKSVDGLVVLTEKLQFVPNKILCEELTKKSEAIANELENVLNELKTIEMTLKGEK
jgi:predicted DNA-binding protein YlxM (UPF0122 family)